MRKSVIILLTALSLTSSIVFAQSVVTNNLYKPQLGVTNVNNSITIPIDGTYEGKLISYQPHYNYDGKYEGRKYILTEKGKVSILKRARVMQNTIGAKSSEEFDKSSDYMPFFDNYNTATNFNLQQMFVEKNNEDELFFSKYAFDNNTNSIVQYKFYISTTFSQKVNGNIETFKIQSWQCGNNLFAFTAYSTFTKQTHVFVSSIDFTNGLGTASITMLDESQFKLPSGYNLSDCTVHSVVKDEYGFNYVFLQFSDKVIPIKCFTVMPKAKDLNIRAITPNTVLSLGVYWELPDNEWSGNIVPMYDQYRTSIEGFVNYYSNNQDINAQSFKLSLYDNSFKKLWEKNLTDIKVSQVYSYGKYIIVGGYTKTKGYLGFPNPRIIVIDKATQAITYDNTIALKNAKIKNISSDYNQNVELTIAIWSEKKNFREKYELTPTIILDKLNDKGAFENNLFQQ